MTWKTDINHFIFSTILMKKNKKLFGEKGTRLLEMTKKGSHVSTGFIVTSASVYYFLIIKKNYFNF